MSHDEMIEVIRAHQIGKTIEARFKFSGCGSSDWERVEIPAWDFYSHEYRVKPKPRIVWLPDGIINMWERIEPRSPECGDGPRTKFVEVI